VKRDGSRKKPQYQCRTCTDAKRRRFSCNYPLKGDPSGLTYTAPYPDDKDPTCPAYELPAYAVATVKLQGLIATGALAPLHRWADSWHIQAVGLASSIDAELRQAEKELDKAKHGG
jgi:hypothetical protein